MKKIFYTLLIFAMPLFFVACDGKQQKQTNEEADAFQIDSGDVHGVQRMQVSQNETTVDMGGKKYHIFVQRTPADSLPRVKNEIGDTYVDNQITLRIIRDKGEKVFSKTFTKNSFSSVVGENFLSKSILEGMVFDKVSPSGLVFAASVSYPQTDLYFPIAITITSSGKLSMEKEEVMEEAYEADSVD